MPARAWAVVPAAGQGLRMGADVPKQYLPLTGKPILQHTVERLAAHPRVRGVLVALAADDRRWPALGFTAPAVRTVGGGAERVHSVLAALDALSGYAGAGDWVMVHDAARPCVRPVDIETLVERASAHPVGGLLALPVRDTMKRAAADGTVAETVERAGLWHALTPQMFRLAPLQGALRAALAAGRIPTDEAQAMELVGARPLLVPAHADNIKVTEPQDLALAELYLRRQAEEGG